MDKRESYYPSRLFSHPISPAVTSGPSVWYDRPTGAVLPVSWDKANWIGQRPVCCSLADSHVCMYLCSDLAHQLTTTLYMHAFEFLGGICVTTGVTRAWRDKGVTRLIHQYSHGCVSPLSNARLLEDHHQSPEDSGCTVCELVRSACSAQLFLLNFSFIPSS